MSLADLAATDAPAPARTQARNTTLCFLVFAFALLWQMRFGVIADTSWAIIMCERVLDGAKLYLDIKETNPPFTLWLYMPPVAAARLLGVPAEALVHLWTYAAAIGGLLFTAAIVRRARFAENAELVLLAPAFLALLVVFPGAAFSEREHIGLALLLPLLALTAWRLKAQATELPGFGIAIAAGLAGSVMMLVKPYYAVVILAPALLVAWRRRDLRPLLAPEYWVILAICAAYLWIVLTIYPEFLRDLYPLLADTYLKVRSDISVVVLYGLPLAMLAWLISRYWREGAGSECAAVATVSAAAAVLPLVYQGKGWAYHAYPAVVLALIALACLWARARHETGLWPIVRGSVTDRRPSLLIVTVIMAAAQAPFFVSQKPPSHVIAAIRAATSNPSVALIGSDLAFAHPLVRMVDGNWISAHCADWLGTMALYLGKRAEVAGDAETAFRYAAIETAYVNEKTSEIAAANPDILVIQKSEPVWVDRLVGKYGYAAIFGKYRLIAENDEIEVRLRKDYVRPRP